MINPHEYSISVRQGTFDNEVCFEARVKEFPDIVEYADSSQDAYELAIDAIETTIEIFAEKGRPVPAPSIPADDYSGRVTLRLPKSLHRYLASASEAEGISLNQYMSNVLSYYSGFANPSVQTPAASWSSLEKTVQKSQPDESCYAYEPS